ncbi:serine/threonine protein kinase [Nonomuraea polychroma]|uniref:Serine/threonine protein kinase n=1 Tax=Nonomuraea polychroma TaxID=46176 RepID=A0A438M8B0_9ACTN|nr:protein kinase [Nonomuraea polychroma]RVX41961.1 serine/threonine protein kinase [Nonomuraea polychroma]
MADPLRDSDPTHIGPYRLHSRLGGGGMGQVFLGRSPGGRLVAVKVVRPELADDTDFRRRFAAEVEAARKVGGFYTAQVVDAGTDASPPWLATAYIPGPSLHQAIEEHGPLPLQSVAVLGAGLAEGLAAVHTCAVVHRDLKPANVILAEDGPRLIDFGIARALDATSHTQSATVLGTAAFMSPEQAMAQKVGPASDVFSLGSVLAFAATGHSPFGTGPVHAVLFRVVHAEPDLSGVPAPLAALLTACLAKDPTARPDLQQVLAHLTALASPGTGPGQGRWLPEALTQIIAERRTLTLTAVDRPAAGGTDSDNPPTMAPPPPGHAGQPRPPQPVNERHHMHGGSLPYPATGYRIAVYVLLALFALVSVSTAMHQLAYAEDAGQMRLLENYNDIHEFSETSSTIMLAAQMIVGVGLLVCWLLWFFRVRVGAERLAPGQLRYRPSMAVYSWFIPIGNLWLPKQIADDIWRASSPPGRSGTMAPAGLLHTWWALWLVTFLTWPLFWYEWTEFLSTHSEHMAYDGSLYHAYEYTPAVWASLALHVLVVPTAIVTARYVRRLSAMQAAKLNS